MNQEASSHHTLCLEVQPSAIPQGGEEEEDFATRFPQVAAAWRELGDRPLAHVQTFLRQLVENHGEAAVVAAIRESAATTHAKDGQAHLGHVKALAPDQARFIQAQTEKERQKQEKWLLCDACDVAFSSLEGHDCEDYRRWVVEKYPWKRLADWRNPPRPPVPPEPVG